MDLGSLGASAGLFPLSASGHLDVAEAVCTSLRVLPSVSLDLRLFVGRFLLPSLLWWWPEFSVLAGALHVGKFAAGDFSGGRKVTVFAFLPDFLLLVGCVLHFPMSRLSLIHI